MSRAVLLGDLEERTDSFQGLGSDIGDLEEFAESLVGASFDDADRGDFADAGEFHEFVTRGGIRIDGGGLESGGSVGGEGQVGFLSSFELSFVRQFLPIGVLPDAGATFGGLKFEVVAYEMEASRARALDGKLGTTFHAPTRRADAFCLQWSGEGATVLWLNPFASLVSLLSS